MTDQAADTITRLSTETIRNIDGFAYELHLHTGEFGWCAKVPAATIVADYEAAGYAGIVVTNHYQKAQFDVMPETSWEGKISNYLIGYEAAKAAVSREEFNVLMGIELRFTENFNDYLVYGISETELVNYPRLYDLTPESFKKLADEKAWIVIQAHPYRRGCEVVSAEYLHGIEVFNENPRHDNKNELALNYAREHDLIMTCGSDYHQLEDLAQAAVIFNEPVTSGRELAQRLLLTKDKNQAAKPGHQLITWNHEEELI